MLGAKGWTRFALVSIVCAGHVAVIAALSHNFSHGVPEKIHRAGSTVISVNFRQEASKPFAEVAVTPIESAGVPENKNSSIVNAVDTQTPHVPTTLVRSGLNSRDYFLDSDKVDTSAQPDEDFSSRLASLLPLTAQNLVLEFWIEKDGRIVEVKCVEGECDSDVLDSLPKLTELVFTPATKNSEAVANRKVIQIDRKLNSGL